MWSNRWPYERKCFFCYVQFQFRRYPYLNSFRSCFTDTVLKCVDKGFLSDMLLLIHDIVERNWKYTSWCNIIKTYTQVTLMSRQSAGINRSFRRVFYIYFNGKLSNLKQGSIFKPMPLIYLNCIILAKKLNLFVWVNGSRSH